VADFRRVYDFVFTSGGVGPTHDDVTIEGVARGLGRKVIRHPAIEGRIREFYKDKANEARLKMAEVPEGTELIVDGRLGFPTLKCENVYVLPGIPEILEQKFNAIRDRFAASPYFLRVIYTSDGEGSIAEHLNATLRRSRAASRLLPEDRRPRVCREADARVEGPGVLERALAHLLGLLPQEAVVRTE